MASISCSHHMPENVIIEILSWLPVKSVIRFRCVCKCWYIVIKDSSFIKKHHDINNARLFVQHYDYNTERYAFGLFSYETLARAPLVYHDLVQMMGYQETIIGPFDGILCLYDGKVRDHDRIALWNPSMREFKPLSVPHPLPPPFKPFIHTFGFGFDVVTNKYKVVLIRHFWDEEEDNPYNPRVVTVYTLGLDSWRVFEAHLQPDRSIDNSLSNTYVNGLYYWLTSHNFYNYKVLSFDMSKETFQEIPPPPNLPNTQWGDLALYIDSIALMLYEPREAEKYFDIWLMKEEGFWTKQLTIGPLLDIARLVGLWKNCELFLDRNTELVLYDHNTYEFKNVGARGINYCLKVVIYKESLFSVKGENECQEGDNSSYLSTSAFIAVSRHASATPLPPSILSRGVGWQGVGILVSRIFETGNGSSVSVENAGLLALTRVGSRRVVQISAGFMIFFSILRKFEAVFASIPAPIISALYLIG
ncbi:F-box/kelch-repeat protein At3g23880-like [Cornus florida]|uniref:F-box/kelch-repeat protein At3g23880-like n=1 Tax=Cornus florida TaxID=4283 RepID=UPI0028A1F532|nr:F-box/kelch-repeat protein At3g23880-like [Cornus florida]